MPPRWATCILENNYITEVSPQESSEPHSMFPNLEGLISGRGGWYQANGAWAQELHRTGGIDIPLLEGACMVLCALGPRQQQWLHRNLNQTSFWSWRVSWAGRGWLSFTPGAWALMVEMLGSVHLPELSWKQTSCGTLAPRPGPSHQQTGYLKNSRAHSHL